MLITTKKGKTILIDGGEDNNILLPYLLDRGIRKFDYIIISHFDSDHYAGITPILGKIKINNLIISKQSEKNAEFEEFIRIARKCKINIVTVSAGNNIIVDEDTNINILWPNETSLKTMDLNNNSIVAKIEHKGIEILYTGDISEDVEKIIIETYPENVLKTDILKVAHHGSNTSSSAEFLEKVKPKISLIGVGKNNKFGHPTEEVIKNLEKVGSKIYRTDLDGEIALIVNEKRENKNRNLYRRKINV